MEGSGRGLDGRTIMVIYRTGAMQRSGWDSTMIKLLMFRGRIKYSATAAVDNGDDNDNGGGIAPPALHRHVTGHDDDDNDDGNEDHLAQDNRVDSMPHRVKPPPPPPSPTSDLM